MAVREDDSDAPEEFTTEQGIKQGEEIRKVQQENKARQVFLSDSDEEEKMEKKTKPKRERPKKSGYEPLDIVILLMIAEIGKSYYLKDIAPAHCVESSLEFLKKRKLQYVLYTEFFFTNPRHLALSTPIHYNMQCEQGEEREGGGREGHATGFFRLLWVFNRSGRSKQVPLECSSLHKSSHSTGLKFEEGGGLKQEELMVNGVYWESVFLLLYCGFCFPNVFPHVYRVCSYRLSHTSKEIRPKLLRQVGIASL
ncbi:hypothetical protein Ancab_026069 [Ancistrocladus abbreviatus]